MNKSAISEWTKGDNLILLEGWARDGLTKQQIAHNMGITTETLRVWSHKSAVISATLKRGREVVDREVENALYKAALSGNITAQIFWLKNRKRQEWADKPMPVITQQEIKDDPLSKAFEELEAGGQNE